MIRVYILPLSSSGDPGQQQPNREGHWECHWGVNSEGTLRGWLDWVRCWCGLWWCGGCVPSSPMKPLVQSPLPQWKNKTLDEGRHPQMLMSLTSVGVHERSTSSSTCLLSVEMLCCCACLRLDSSSDSICSWHDRRQSCGRNKKDLVSISNLVLRQFVCEKAARKCGTYWVTPDNLGQVVSKVLGG